MTAKAQSAKVIDNLLMDRRVVGFLSLFIVLLGPRPLKASNQSKVRMMIGMTKKPGW